MDILHPPDAAVKLNSDRMFYPEYVLPVQVNERLLQQGRGALALVLNALYGLREDLSGELTIRDFLALLQPFGISARAIRCALADGLIECTGVDVYGRGRPIKLFRVPTYQDACRAIHPGHYDPIIDPLQPGDLETVCTLRIAMHREFIQRKETESRKHGLQPSFSRKYLAQRLGVHRATVRRYDRPAGIYAIKKYKIVDVLDAGDLPESIERGPIWLQARHPEDHQVVKEGPIKRSLAEHWQRQGWRVVICQQLTNEYTRRLAA